MKSNYDNRIVIKPWGEEYNIFRNKKKIAITYLKIEKGKSTSLHCHPNKKTGFLILSGVAEVQLGIYKKNTIKYKQMSILVLRPGLFHRIRASKKSDLYALEVESPYIKKDLIRMEDNYGRKNQDYENLDKTKAITMQNIIFKKPKINKKNIYYLNGIKISLAYYKNFNSWKSKNDNTISIIVDGFIVNDKKKIVIKEGEIIKSLTLKNLSKNFNIKNKILVLKAKKIIK